MCVEQLRALVALKHALACENTTLRIVAINNELPSPSYQGSEGTHSSADPHAAPSNGSPASDAHVFFKPNKETTCGIALGVKTKIAELTKSRHGVGLSLDANNLVTKVGSKAARDGVMVGDRIVAIDGEVISADKPASGILKGIAVGSTVQLKLLGERAAVGERRAVGEEGGRGLEAPRAAARGAHREPARVRGAEGAPRLALRRQRCPQRHQRLVHGPDATDARRQEAIALGDR